MDWYMFTPAEHEYLRFMETNVVPVRAVLEKEKELEPEPQVQAQWTRKAWRKYGEKTNVKKGETREYYKCTSCTGRRVEVYDLSGSFMRNEVLINCSRHRRKKGG